MDNRIKSILLDYYKEASDNALIPQPVLSKVLDQLIKNGAKKIIQFVYYENAYNDKIVFPVLSDRAAQCEVVRFYAIRFLKHLRDNRCNYLLDRDSQANIKSSICVLSKAKREALPDFAEFILIDDKIAIVNRSVMDVDNVYSEDADVVGNCKKWLDFAMRQSKMIYSDDFLQEPLMQSADMLYEAATVFCSNDHVNSKSCQWYHSIWQYLRLLDMVSTPSWHHDFYCKHLLSNVGHGGPANVLISGTADYSMLAYVYHVANEKSIRATVSVLDMCETPLIACQWYAKKTGKTVIPIKENIFKYSTQLKYDMICADAFLTRFAGEQLMSVLKKWKELLQDNGSIVTTVRVHDDAHACPAIPEEDAVQKFKTKAIQRTEVWGKYINLTPEEMGVKAEYYARTMVSNFLGSKEHIIKTINQCGFVIEHIEDVEVAGELYPSRYLRLVLRPKD